MVSTRVAPPLAPLERGKMDDRIEEIAGEEGFYKQDTRDAFLSVFKQLVKSGIDADDVIDMLEKLFYAMAGEFGG